MATSQLSDTCIPCKVCGPHIRASNHPHCDMTREVVADPTSPQPIYTGGAQVKGQQVLYTEGATACAKNKNGWPNVLPSKLLTLDKDPSVPYGCYTAPDLPATAASSALCHKSGHSRDELVWHLFHGHVSAIWENLQFCAQQGGKLLAVPSRHQCIALTMNDQHLQCANASGV